MGYIIYIGAALIVGLLIGFIALSVIMLRRTMLRNVRSHTLGLISVFDTILDKKSAELRGLEAELKEKENIAHQQELEQRQQSPVPVQVQQGISPAQMLSLVERSGADSYRDSSVGDTYHLIRDNFAFDLARVISLAEKLPRAEVSEPLPRELSWDAAFELSTLPLQQQLELLHELLSPQNRSYLDQYLQQSGEFNIFRFYDSLESRREEQLQGTRLFVSRAAARSVPAAAGLELVEDSSICEGFQVAAGGRLYDYSIKTKELN